MVETCLIFSPHQDDACLACGGVILKKTKKKENIVIINTCNGRNVFLLFFGVKDNPSPKEIEQIRNEEDIKAMNLLGVPKENIIFLGFEDVLMYKQRKNAEEKILELIKKIKPSEVYIPSDIEIHPDHIITSEVVKKCLRKINFKNPVYEYYVWSRSKIKEKKDLITVDISEELDMKKKAIQEYKSQVEIFLPQQKEPVLEKEFINQFYQNKEFFKKIDIFKNENILYKFYKGIKVRFISLLWTKFKI